MIQIKASRAWIQFAKKNQKKALELMQESAAMEDSTEKHPVTPGEVLPARELLGDLLLAMDRPSEALEAYELDLKIHPNRFNGIYGAAVAAKNARKMEMAYLYFEKLIELARSSGSGRREVMEAREFIKQKAV